MNKSNMCGQRTVFCIEDEADIRKELVFGLSKFGFKVMSARSGEEALSLLGAERPDLILCDVLMPGFGGLELLKRIRSTMPHLSSTPFILLSALADRSHILEGLRLGADDYLTKPIDFDLLETKITRKMELVERSRESASALDASDSPAPAPMNETRARLTKRELQVLSEFAKGHTNGQVAQILGLSEHTVGDHSKSILKKLNAASRTHAVHEAIALGLVIVDKAKK
ncbi:MULTISPECIES: response regulator transcription factor [Brucella]|jgi:DNA-binding NarL/FixJ family response regulator|uniref:response regulator transcription factor n=1 Tax=Brucella TaxID=234 RepID=UPI0023616E0F|nr:MULTISPECIES: response regulator transcription factor [Brucella]WLF99722.1 response regulator transcription factor [Brucella intermedia]